MCRRLCARDPSPSATPASQPHHALGLMYGHQFLPTLAWLALSTLTASPRKPGSQLIVWLSQKTPALFSQSSPEAACLLDPLQTTRLPQGPT